MAMSLMWCIRHAGTRLLDFDPTTGMQSFSCVSPMYRGAEGKNFAVSQRNDKKKKKDDDEEEEEEDDDDADDAADLHSIGFYVFW